LAECYRWSGADPDGNEDWRLADRAVEEVKRLRQESDEENTRLEAEVAGLRQELQETKSFRVQHARIQGAANSWQQGWQAALQRVSEGDSVESLRSLIPVPPDVDVTDLVLVLREQVETIGLVANSLHDVAVVEWSPVVDAKRWSRDNETYLRNALERITAALDTSAAEGVLAGLRALITQLEAIPQLSASGGHVVYVRDVNAVIQQANILLVPGRPARSQEET